MTAPRHIYYYFGFRIEVHQRSVWTHERERSPHVATVDGVMLVNARGDVRTWDSRMQATEAAKRVVDGWLKSELVRPIT